MARKHWNIYFPISDFFHHYVCSFLLRLSLCFRCSSSYSKCRQIWVCKFKHITCLRALSSLLDMSSLQSTANLIIRHINMCYCSFSLLTEHLLTHIRTHTNLGSKIGHRSSTHQLSSTHTWFTASPVLHHLLSVWAKLSAVPSGSGWEKLSPENPLPSWF